MVFSTTTLFKGIACPEGGKCTLTNCIFSHDLRPSESASASSAGQVASASQPEALHTSNEDVVPLPAAKRRKVTYRQAENKPLSRAEVIRNQLAVERKKDDPASVGSTETTTTPPKLAPPSLSRPVSPPPKTKGTVTSDTSSTATHNGYRNGIKRDIAPPTTVLKEALNPRLIPNDPAGHAKRSLYLKYMHAEMMRLNDLVVSQVGQKHGPEVTIEDALVLRGNELIKLVLDEEEELARGKGNVYANVVKNRIAAYKKMSLGDWIAHVKSTTFFTNQNQSVKPSMSDGKPIDTGLTPEEEVAMLPYLTIKDQSLLAKFGYVPNPPTAEQAAEAAEAVLMSKNFEVCDRCSARFRIFPERNEDGLLASGGKCRYHPNRKMYPAKMKADTGPKEPYYPCCNEVVGSAGCTEAEYHTFKTGSSARLHAVCPFIVTPENGNPARDRGGKEVKAVVFDCEMGYTTLGLELIRLSAVHWPEGRELIDCLVRPLGTVLDLNSRFSGVLPEHFANAVPYDQWLSRREIPPPFPTPDDDDDFPSPPALPVVDSPQAARDLLCSFLKPDTPLMGHAIENDLNVIRLCHPAVIDTAIAFSHPRGLPMRYGLRMLAAKYLHRNIQTGGERGHDSLEDARATGDLVRVKVSEKWKLLRAQGWKFVNGQLTTPPPPIGKAMNLLESTAAGDGEPAKRLLESAVDSAGVNRRGMRMDGSADDSRECEVSERREVDKEGQNLLLPG